MREKYESLSLTVLKDLAKARGLKGVSLLRKPELIERMLEADEKEKNNADGAIAKEEIKLSEKQQTAEQSKIGVVEKEEKSEGKTEENTEEKSESDEVRRSGYKSLPARSMRR